MARPPALFVALSSFLWAGCHSLPVFFAPPAQKPALASTAFVMMSDPAADAFIVQGFRAHSEGAWRWTHDHPVLRFVLPETGALNFRMDFTLPEATFRETGATTLSIAVNARLLDRVHCDHAGDYHYEHAVPEELLHKPGVNLMAIDPDKTATAEKLGFVLQRAGFVE